MKIAAKHIPLLLVLALFMACSASSVHYETYHNERYGYWVDYPDFLLPQGEASSQDGQRFISADEQIQLLVYYEYKNDFAADGGHLPLHAAYEADLQGIEAVISNTLAENHYRLEYQVGQRMHADYVLLDGYRYFNIRFEYPATEQARLQTVIAHVFSSFRLDAPALVDTQQADTAWSGETTHSFPAFLTGFLQENYWGRNINSLLRSNDAGLAAYLDPEMDVRRYYAPGTVAKLASRAEDFAFAQEDDFTHRPVLQGELVLERLSDTQNPCELDFNPANKIYYQKLTAVPDVVVNSETLATAAVPLTDASAELMAVFLPDAYSNPRGFYFVLTPTGWKLALVDDALCGA